MECGKVGISKYRNFGLECRNSGTFCKENNSEFRNCFEVREHSYFRIKSFIGHINRLFYTLSFEEQNSAGIECHFHRDNFFGADFNQK